VPATTVETSEQVERILDASVPLGERAELQRAYIRKKLNNEVGRVEAHDVRERVACLENDVAELWRRSANFDYPW